MAETPKVKKVSRLDMFTKATHLSVEGDELTLTTVHGPDGEDFHVTPKKFSKKDAAKIRKLLTRTAVALSPAVRGRIIRAKKDAPGEFDQKELMDSLSDEDLAALFAESADDESVLEVQRAKLICGIARQDFTDEPGPMTPELADLVLEAPAVADEILAAVDELNPPFLAKSAS